MRFDSTRGLYSYCDVILLRYVITSTRVLGYLLVMHQTATHSELRTSTSLGSSHAVGNQADVLQRILNHGVNLSLWQRPAQQAITQELLPLEAGQLPDVRCRTSPASFDADLCVLLTKHDLDPLNFEQWRIDLGGVAERFFGISKGREVTLRLETTATDGCRRFHIDHTHLRLLCTYRGPGTEWLPEGQVDRVAQANGAPNRGIVRFGNPSHNNED